jgi:hypothetical protein
MVTAGQGCKARISARMLPVRLTFRILCDNATLRVSQTTISQFATLPLHHKSVFMWYAPFHIASFCWRAFNNMAGRVLLSPCGFHPSVRPPFHKSGLSFTSGAHESLVIRHLHHVRRKAGAGSSRHASLIYKPAPHPSLVYRLWFSSGISSDRSIYDPQHDQSPHARIAALGSRSRMESVRPQ